MLFEYSKRTEVLNTGVTKGYRLANTVNNQIVELSIDKGAMVPEHNMEMNVSFYVISGKGLALVEGEEISAQTGDVLFVEKGKMRGWKNPNEETLKVLVIKSH